MRFSQDLALIALLFLAVGCRSPAPSEDRVKIILINNTDAQVEFGVACGGFTHGGGVFRPGIEGHSDGPGPNSTVVKVWWRAENGQRREVLVSASELAQSDPLGSTVFRLDSLDRLRVYQITWREHLDTDWRHSDAGKLYGASTTPGPRW